MVWMLCLVLILAPTPRDAAKPQWGEVGYTFSMIISWAPPVKMVILEIRERDGEIEVGYAGDPERNVVRIINWNELRNLTKCSNDRCPK